MSRWKEKKERGALWTMSFMHWLCRYKLEGLVQVLLYPIAAYFFLTGGEVRRASYDYFRHVKGDCALFDHYKQLLCFARSLVDRVLLLMGETHGFKINAAGRNQVLALKEKGQGVIFLGAHLGSFEAGKVFAKDNAGLDVYIVAHHEQSKKVRAVLDKTNPEMLERIIDPDTSDAVFRMREAIESGGILTILADRTAAGGKTVGVSFLGEEVNLPAGPYMLASVLRCPVFCFFAVRTGYRDYESFAVKLADQVNLPRDKREESLVGYAQKYADILAEHTRKFPYHWFNFYDYWQNEGKDEK